jgi:hypothetical protein
MKSLKDFLCKVSNKKLLRKLKMREKEEKNEMKEKINT